jgi:hypothetical protein
MPKNNIGRWLVDEQYIGNARLAGCEEETE